MKTRCNPRFGSSSKGHAVRLLPRTCGRGYMTPELDRRRFLKLAGATAFVAACGGSTATASPSVTASVAPKATGRISIYSALNESTNNQLFAAVTKATGVEVSALPLAAAGDLQTKIT